MGWGQFSRFIRFEVGSGTKITFWDWWGGDGALKDFFPTLYSTALIKSAAVVDYLCWNMGSIHGHVTFCNGFPRLGVGNAN